jgi:hypothetical protein
MFQSIFFRYCAIAVAFAGVFPCLPEEAAAQARSAQARSAQSRNVTRTNVNRSANVNQNVNVNRNVNVDVDNHRDYHPFATAAAVTAGVAITSAVIGSITHSLPPSCSAVAVNGITYQQCGSAWYQPQYTGTQVSYVVVNPPQ